MPQLRYLQVRYTLFGVIATLAYVETERAAIDLAPPAYAEDVDHETVTQDAITSRIRKTLRHLQAVGGRWAWWRGGGIAIAYHLAFVIVSGILSGLLNVITFSKIPYLDQVIGSMIASLALIHWQTAWTHIVISEPSPKRWIHRVPAWRLTLNNVWLATAVHELASRLAFVIPLSMAYGMGLTTAADQGAGALIGKAVAALLMWLVLTVAIVIPAGVVLTRVQASMLPEEDETIVPFDRSFGGKVEPAIIGGSGAISFVDGWKTFESQGRARVFRLLGKILIVEIGLHLVLGAILGGEIAAFVRNDAGSPPQT